MICAIFNSKQPLIFNWFLCFDIKYVVEAFAFVLLKVAI